MCHMHSSPRVLYEATPHLKNAMLHAAAVGMEISVPLFFAKLKTIVAAMALLIAGKVAVMTAVGQAFGLTVVQSMRRLVMPHTCAYLPWPAARHVHQFGRCSPGSRATCSPRSGLLLSPGGEFAFVLFGEAVARGIMGAALAKELYLVVALRQAWHAMAVERSCNSRCSHFIACSSSADLITHILHVTAWLSHRS